TITATDNSICDPALTVPVGQFNGSITASITNGGNPEDPADYTFRWYTGTIVDPANLISTTNGVPDLQNLNGGYYTVVATHATLACNAIPQVVEIENVQVLPAITASATPSDNCDPALANGIVRVTDVDGNGIASPYVFEWFAGNTASGTAIASTAEVTGLQGGAGIQFTVLVTNQNSGCQNTFILGLSDASELPALTLVASDNTICDPSLTDPPVQFNGSISGTPSHPRAGNFEFSWYTGVGNDPANIINGETSANLNNLEGDFYSATVMHEPTGCISAPVVIEVNNIPDIPGITTSISASTNCLPDGSPNGAATVTEINGIAPSANFTFEWFEGDDTSGTSLGNAAAATGLQGGLNREYTVLVTNRANGCQNTQTILLGDASILPALTLLATDNTVCDPVLTNPAVDFNGEIVASPSHPDAGTFEFSWFTGTTADPLNQIAGVSNAILSNLNGDFYTAVVK
ncbi:MAG TPA: hypothetical protein PKC24_16115, partial [Cyclobacteriaceae bacterium]|nr:hypothetical protein [Cyclobacteriaceae bacterium]